MMLIRCRVAPSPIEGLGVFALESVATGQPVWRLDLQLDRLLAPESLHTLPPEQQEFFHRYTYYEQRLGALVLCCDDARFMNHSPEPNVSEVRDGMCIALRPIVPGEELTCDYHHLDPRPMTFEVRT